MITTYAQLLPPAWAPPTPPTPARWPANSGWNDLIENLCGLPIWDCAGHGHRALDRGPEV